MNIKSIEVEGFRGFINKKKFNINNSKIIILYGPNGHGKTSFYDAIEWGLTGRIYRYDNSNDERNRTKFIANQTSENAVPRVKLVIDYNGNEITIIRTGKKDRGIGSDYGVSDLIIIDEKGNDVENTTEYLSELMIKPEWYEKVNLENMNKMYNLTHNLGQEKITHFINDTKDGERYNSLSTMLGTDYFRKYETKFKNVRKEISEKISAQEKNVESLYNEQNYLNKEYSSIQKEMSNQKITIEEIEALLKAFNKKFKYDLKIDDDLSELPKIFNKIKEKELLKENKLAQEISNVKSIYNRLITFKEELKYETLYIRKKNKIEDLSNYKKEYLELTNLDKTLKQLKDTRRSLNSSKEYYRKLNDELDIAQKYYNDFYNIWIEIKKSIKKAQVDEEFNIATELLEENLLYSKKFELINKELLNISKYNYKLSMLEEKKTLLDKLVTDSQNSLNSITDLKDEHNQIMTLTIKYMDKHHNLSHCPVCGTKEISSEDVMNHLENLNHDSELSILVQKNQEYNQKLEEIKKEINNTKKDLDKHRKDLNKIMVDIDKDIIKLKVEIESSEDKKESIYKDIQNAEHILLRVNESLEKFKISVKLDTETLVIKVKELLNDKSTEINKIYDELKINKNSDLVNLKKQNKDKLSEIKHEENNLRHLVSDYGHTGDFNIVEFESFITNKYEKFNEEQQETTKKIELVITFQSKFNEFKLYNKMSLVTKKLELNARKLEAEEHLRKELDDNLKIIDRLIKSVPGAIDKLNEESLKELFNLVQQIYSKINSHPLYKKIDFDASVRFRSNKLLLNVLTDNGISSNPTFIYSSAQIRTLAISLFLAMSIKQKWSPLNFICMDDPIQSMDDLNTISFIDLMRTLVSESGLNKQIFISTHNSNFYDMLRKKFRMYDFGLIEYESYGDEGPLFVKGLEEDRDENEVIRKKSYYDENIAVDLLNFLNDL